MFNLYQVFLLRNRETLILKLFFLTPVNKTEAVQPNFKKNRRGKDDRIFKILRGKKFLTEIKVDVG
jgi:hypothetical protein